METKPQKQPTKSELIRQKINEVIDAGFSLTQISKFSQIPYHRLAYMMRNNDEPTVDEAAMIERGIDELIEDQKQKLQRLSSMSM
jgi:ribosome maturation factor RimP